MCVCVGVCVCVCLQKLLTAEEVACAAKHPEIEAILRRERLNAPAQCILLDKKRNKGCWIGDHVSAVPFLCDYLLQLTFCNVL